VLQLFVYGIIVIKKAGPRFFFEKRSHIGLGAEIKPPKE
jgi:hypothetical protein